MRDVAVGAEGVADANAHVVAEVALEPEARGVRVGILEIRIDRAGDAADTRHRAVLAELVVGERLSPKLLPVQTMGVPVAQSSQSNVAVAEASGLTLPEALPVL